MELAELKKLQEEARQAAQTVQSSLNEVGSGIASIEKEVDGKATGADVGAPAETTPADYAWEGAGETWRSSVFPKRYKAGPSVDELAEELARLKRQMAMPAGHAGVQRKYAPRARVSRPRIRR